MRRRGVAAAVVVSLAAGLVPAVPAAADVTAPVSAAGVPAEGASASAAWAKVASVERAPEQLEDLLPPGARQVLSVFKIFKGLSARNRVYREARHVQRDLRAHYEARIAKADELLANRRALGLSESQVRAYTRARLSLKSELDAGLAVTEFEKRAAKYGFESAFRRELVGALLLVPKVQAGLRQVRSAVQDLRERVAAVQTAIASGNPVAALTDEIEQKVAKLEEFSDIAGMISGKAGADIRSLGARVRRTIAPIRESLDEAAGAAGQVIAELDSVDSALERRIETERSPRAGIDVGLDEQSVIGQLAAPGGEHPSVDVISDIVARQATRIAATQTTEARVELRRMRDRVQASLLGRSLERIGEICGRIAGVARRAQLEAVAAGDPPPSTSTECTHYGNPDALQALIDAERAEQSDEPDTTDVTEPTEPTDEIATGDPPGGGGGELEITEFEYTAADIALEAGAGYYNPRLVFSVSGDTVRVDVTTDVHHAWVTSPEGVTCWAYYALEFTGQTTLARNMEFALEVLPLGPVTLEGPTCAEFPFDYDQYEEDEQLILPVRVEDDGTLSGGMVGEGFTLFEFG